MAPANLAVFILPFVSKALSVMHYSGLASSMTNYLGFIILSANNAIRNQQSFSSVCLEKVRTF